MDFNITDLHMQVVAGVDDGSTSLAMSLDMLGMAYEQGVRNIFCTSHNVYEAEKLARLQISVYDAADDGKNAFSQ